MLCILIPEILSAELRINRVDWRSASPLGHRATIRLIVRGRGPSGALQQLEQNATLRVRFFDPFWKITEEENTTRALVTLETLRFEWLNEAIGISSVHANEHSPPSGSSVAATTSRSARPLEPPLAISTGTAATRVDEIQIDWPSGERTVLRDLAADRLFRIIEGAETFAEAR
jgi:hypothetical protein